MPTIEQLNQRHPCLDPEEDADLEAVYQGGKLFESRLKTFLPQRPREMPERYATRKREHHYRNYLGAIVDYFAAMLFTSKPSASAKSKGATEALTTLPKYYAAFSEDCDRLGGDIDAFFKDRITTAMVHRRAWFALEQPSDGGAPAPDRASFERRKLGDAWLRKINNEAIFDWELDDAGNLAWVLVHSISTRRASVGAKRTAITETWDQYLSDRVDTYAITYEKDKPPAPDAEVPLRATRPHRFGRVPVFCLELPLGLWAANRLKTPQLAHFRSSNAQSWSLAATCYAMPVAKVGDPDAAQASNIAHGAGYAIYLYKDESWEWEAPPADHFAALDVEIKSHKDEIFRIAHQMALGVDNNSSAVGRTAESKSADAQSTRVILTAYGRVVKETIELVYDTISRARGDDIVWSIGGLDDFAGVDTGGLLTMCGELQTAGGIPSKSFNADLKYKLATSMLPDADEARKQLYKREIEDNTPDPAEDAALEREATLALLRSSGVQNGPGEGSAPGSKPAGQPQA
ncbi:portal protein [Caudoviricetes sp.]|nr:portal protein [Caudoviricetes sp.]